MHPAAVVYLSSTNMSGISAGILQEDAPCFYLDIVPTILYRVVNQAWTPRSAIPFYSVDTRQLGVSLAAAMHRSSRDLLGPNDHVFDDTSRVKVTFHIKWGEYPFFSKARNITSQKRMQTRSITREKTAHEVAKLVKAFIDQAASQPVMDDRWRAGPGCIQLEHVYLLELRNVSVGSYQAILAVSREANYY